MRNLIPLCLAALLSMGAAAQQQCTQQAYGQGCGPTLAVSFYEIGGGQHKISVLMENGFPQSHGLWIWGIQDIRFPIPGSSCFLCTDFVYGHPFVSEANGSALMEHAWPSSANGAFVRLQAVSLMVDQNNQLVIRSTNGVFAECH